jgi:hypothetical protein
VSSNDAIGSAPETIKGRYRVVETLRQTADAVVHVADDLEKDRRVTLTVLHGAAAADAEFTDAVRQQAQRLARPEVAHAAVARVYGCDTTEHGALFVACEHVAGRTLRAILDERGALDLRSALRLVNQIGEALETLHPNGVVHGELRPESIVITTKRDGVDGVKLAGLELVTAHQTSAGLRLRDPSLIPYLAPEQIERGETTEAADVHALGLLIRELVTGQRPGVPGARPGASELPPAIRRIVARALAHHPARRYGSVSLMLNELWSAESGAPAAAGITAQPAAERRSSAGRYARSDLGMATALVLGLVLVGATAWVVTSDRLNARTSAGERPPAASPSTPAAPASPVNAIAAEPARGAGSPGAPVEPRRPAATVAEPVRPGSLAVAPAAPGAPGTVPDPARATGVRPVELPPTPVRERAPVPPSPPPSAPPAPPVVTAPPVAPPPAEVRARQPAPAPVPPPGVKAPPPARRDTAAAPADASDGSAIIDWLLKARRPGD